MKALFVGLGSIGQRHLRNLRRLKPEVQISAVRRTRTAPVLSDNNQVITGANISRHYDLKEFDSLDSALEECPDIVFVTNPSNIHIDVTAKALDSGAFVFVEKPLSCNWDGVEELAKAERAQGGKKIAIGYHFRFHPAMKLVKSMLEQDRIGRIVSARQVNGEYLPGWHPYEDYRISYAARRDLGGGALVTQIHDFDYALWFFGRPQQVFSVGGQLSSLDLDVEDSVQVLMKFEQEGRPLPVSISLDYLQWPPSRGFSIIGDNGRIDCDLIRSLVSLSDLQCRKTEHHEFLEHDCNDIFLDELRDFLSFVSGKNGPSVPMEEGMASLRVALAARQSMETGSSIPLTWN